MSNGNRSLTGTSSTAPTRSGTTGQVPLFTNLPPESQAAPVPQTTVERNRQIASGVQGASLAEALARQEVLTGQRQSIAGTASPTAGVAGLVNLFNQQAPGQRQQTTQQPLFQPRREARAPSPVIRGSLGGFRGGLGLSGLAPGPSAQLGAGGRPAGAPQTPEEAERLARQTEAEELALETQRLQNALAQQQFELQLRQQQALEQGQQADILSQLTRGQIAPEGQQFLSQLLAGGPSALAQQGATAQQAAQGQLGGVLGSLSGLATDPLGSPQLQTILGDLERRFAEGQQATIARGAEAAGSSASALRSLLETEGRARLAGQQAQTILNAQLQAAGQLPSLASAIQALSTDPAFAQLLQLGALAPSFQTQQQIGEVAPLPAFDPSQFTLAA